MNKNMIIGIGNVYLETDLFGVDTKGSNHLEPEISYSSTSYQTYIGGSTTNFIKQLKKLGSTVALLAKVGKDETAKEIKRLLKAEGIIDNLVIESADVQTSIVVAIVLSHNGQHIPTTGGNANQKLESSNINFDHPLFKEASTVLLSGYFKQSKLWKDYPLITKKFHAEGLRVFLDPQRPYLQTSEEQIETLWEALQFTEGLFLNEQELLVITREDKFETALKKISSSGPKFIAVKRGEKGCLVVGEDQQFEVKGISVSAVSTVGAGDSFNAGFIYYYLQGKNLKDCAKFANATAALKVSTNRLPIKDEVLAFLDNQNP